LAAGERNIEFGPTLVRMKDGREALVRPATPEDRIGLEQMFHACSSETLFTRFLSPGLGVPLRYLNRLMDHQPPARIALIAEDEEDGEKRVVALLNFVLTEPPQKAEIAIVVVDSRQNRGLGNGMLQCLLDAARQSGIRQIIADIDAGNRRVFHLIQRSKLPARMTIDQGVAHVELELRDPGKPKR
jgi:acetyltransferase